MTPVIKQKKAWLKKRADSPHPGRVSFAKSPEKSASEKEDQPPVIKGAAQKGAPDQKEEAKETPKKEKPLELRAPSPAAGTRRASEDRTSPSTKVSLREKLKAKGRSS